MYHKNLSTEEAQKKQRELGKNVLPEKKPRGKWAIFLSQFINPLVYILILVGLVSLSMGKYEELAFIFAVVLVNAVVGFFQENKTEKTLAALKNLIHPTARVVRDTY